MQRQVDNKRDVDGGDGAGLAPTAVGLLDASPPPRLPLAVSLLASASTLNGAAAGPFLVWDVAGAVDLRRRHRVIGQWTGTLPRLPSQNVFLGAPLCLATEEVWLLLREDAVTIIDERKPPEAPTLSDLEEQLDSAVRDIKLLQGATAEYKAAIRASVPPELRAKRSARKSRPLSTTATGDAQHTDKGNDRGTLSEASVGLPSPPPGPVTTFLSTSDLVRFRPRQIAVTATTAVQDFLRVVFPEQSVEERRLLSHRCLIFEWLWRAGWTMTNGVKFGGDFLLYKGDPIQHHSSLVVNVVDPDSHTFRGLDAVMFGRLARNTKKERVLCAWDEVARPLEADNDGGTGDAFGIDGGGTGDDPSSKPARKIRDYVKFDASILSSSEGLPKLLRLAKKRLKFKPTKGNELRDLTKILEVYQLWGHSLYPSAQFHELVDMTGKLCHEKRMKVTKEVLLEEEWRMASGYYDQEPPPDTHAEPSSEPHQDPTVANDNHQHAALVGDAEADDLEEFEERALARLREIEEEEAEAAQRRQLQPPTNGAGEAVPLNPAPTLSAVYRRRPIVDEDDDEESFAGPVPPPLVGAVVTGGSTDEPGGRRQDQPTSKAITSNMQGLDWEPSEQDLEAFAMMDEDIELND
ncbi:tRNA-splicing endonuclease subunit [Cladochytrium tenue]|nr:tRNA-splicing endonuclease subunit [Cladochytrium tenue]